MVHRILLESSESCSRTGLTDNHTTALSLSLNQPPPGLHRSRRAFSTLR